MIAFKHGRQAAFRGRDQPLRPKAALRLCLNAIIPQLGYEDAF